MMLCQTPQRPAPGVLVLRVPADMAPQGLPERCEVRLYPGERKVWRSRRGQRCAQWAEANRVVTMSSRPGQWRNDTTPYLAGIMDASWHPSVRVVICCKTPQVGMSEAVNNCIGYAIDCDPAPVLYVYPDEITARHNSDARIQQMINDTPRLASYKTGYQDDMATLEIKLQHMALYLAWASSAAGLANKPIKYLVLDEVDKYPPAGKREADPISLAEQRLTTYEDDSKAWKISTPTVEAGAIWQALRNEAQEIYHYWVRCPLCGCWQLMRFGERDDEGRKPGGIRFPSEERNPETIEAKRLAWYECEHCRGQWTDALRNKAVRLGEWRDEEGCELMASLRTKRPTKIGFHIPAWISPFVSLSKCAAEFLRGRKDKTKMRNFMNGIKAEPWVDYQVERSEDRILALRDERPEGVVPSGGVVAGVVAAVDTQDEGFWYEVRAFGFGMIQESWQVRQGYVQTFEALHQVLFEEPIADAQGNEYYLELAVIDSQGHRTSEVYDWARARRGRVLPLKGFPRLSQPYKLVKVDSYLARSGKRVVPPSGLTRLDADVNYYKNKLASQLEINPADPGAWHLLQSCPPSWAKQMTVEYIDDQGLWACPQHLANHAWDCSVYSLIAADLKRLRFRPRPEEIAPVPQHKPKEPLHPGRSTRW